MRSQTRQLYLKLNTVARREIYNVLSFSSTFRHPYHHILILGHMRSGSSLLTQILVSNPEILGYGETHLGYHKSKDINAVIGKIYKVRGRVFSPGHEKYILDKVLHDYLFSVESVELLNNVETRLIFLLREPVGTIPSVMKLLGYSEAKAVDYYLSRLDSLEKIAEEYSSKNKIVFMTYEQLLFHTQLTLSMLREYLDLDQPLSEYYEIRENIDYGNDPSEVLKSGKVVRNIVKKELPILSNETIHICSDAFDNIKNSLSTYCINLDTFSHQQSSDRVS